MNTDWLVLAYTLPPEPSRKRVAVWRRLRKLGAVYLSEGFWFLPRTPALEEAMREIALQIRLEEGTSWSFVAKGVLPMEAGELTGRFNDARREEYAEVSRQCEKFLAHVARETEYANFDFAMIEELEHDLEKRLHWLAEVRERDVLRADGCEGVDAMLDECRKALDRYVEEAYKRLGVPQ